MSGYWFHVYPILLSSAIHTVLHDGAFETQTEISHGAPDMPYVGPMNLATVSGWVLTAAGKGLLFIWQHVITWTNVDSLPNDPRETFQWHWIKINVKAISKLLSAKWQPYVQATVCLWSSEAIWWHKSVSTFAQVMVCYLTTTSYYLKKCWLIINGDLWHSSKANFPESAQNITGFPHTGLENFQWFFNDISRQKSQSSMIFLNITKWKNTDYSSLHIASSHTLAVFYLLCWMVYQ